MTMAAQRPDVMIMGKTATFQVTKVNNANMVAIIALPMEATREKCTPQMDQRTALVTAIVCLLNSFLVTPKTIDQQPNDITMQLRDDMNEIVRKARIQWYGS